MRRDLAEPGLSRIPHDRLEDRLIRNRTVPDPSALRHTPQHGPAGDLGGGGPGIERRLGPGRHRDGADAAVLAEELDDRPAALALRHISKLQPGELPPPQPAAHQQPQQDPVPQAFDRFRIGRGQQPAGLLEGQPVAGPDSGAAGAGDAADPGGSERREPAVCGSLGSELAQGGEREVDRGGREPALDQVLAVAPQHGPYKTLSGGV